jgi:hypothetical protein
MKELQPYHYVWLEHREKSVEWLRERMAEGFHIHHIDGDHNNNDKSNLALVYGKDHIEKLHAGSPSRSSSSMGISRKLNQRKKAIEKRFKELEEKEKEINKRWKILTSMK